MRPCVREAVEDVLAFPAPVWRKWLQASGSISLANSAGPIVPKGMPIVRRTYILAAGLLLGIRAVGITDYLEITIPLAYLSVAWLQPVVSIASEHGNAECSNTTKEASFQSGMSRICSATSIIQWNKQMSSMRCQYILNLNICTKARADMTPQKRDGVDDAFTLPAVPNGRANAGKERTTASTGTFLHLARTKVAGAQHKAAVAPVPLYTHPVPRDGHRCHLPGRRRAKRILK
uniref:Uncharacterized protein n=1 Tax=Oryza nivara TaxID=4536 RepID=A0A0E0FVW5_ORYNI